MQLGDCGGMLLPLLLLGRDLRELRLLLLLGCLLRDLYIRCELLLLEEFLAGINLRLDCFTVLFLLPLGDAILLLLQPFLLRHRC